MNMSLMVNKKRITKSLGTKDRNRKDESKLKSLVKTIILQQLNGLFQSNAELSFPGLVDRSLNAPHSWSKSTCDLNKYILTSHPHKKEFMQ